MPEYVFESLLHEADALVLAHDINSDGTRGRTRGRRDDVPFRPPRRPRVGDNDLTDELARGCESFVRPFESVKRIFMGHVQLMFAIHSVHIAVPPECVGDRRHIVTKLST